MERTLDWRPNPDLRSFNFLLSTSDQESCFADGQALDRIRYRKNVFLDQGQEGACTGFGLQHVRALTPHPATDASNDLAFKTYYEAQKLDEWAGEDYSGSSVNGAMRAAREFGWITSWYWCLSLAEIDHALSFHGALEVGSNWYESMFQPDANGYLVPSGEVSGGHAWALSGRSKLDGRVRYRMENSWGPGWGRNGGAYIWVEDLQRLLDEGAEVAYPVKVSEDSSNYVTR